MLANYRHWVAASHVALGSSDNLGRLTVDRAKVQDDRYNNEKAWSHEPIRACPRKILPHDGARFY